MFLYQGMREYENQAKSWFSTERSPLHLDFCTPLAGMDWELHIQGQFHGGIIWVMAPHPGLKSSAKFQVYRLHQYKNTLIQNS